MKSDLALAHDRRPRSEVEWEDLLIRMEVMPRVARLLLEDLDRAVPAVDRVLERLTERESFVGDFLERAMAGPDAERRYLSGDKEVAALSTTEMMDRFMRLRMRNFAMVQRRGINVWEQEAVMNASVRATVHQVLSQLVAEDVAAIASLRDATHLEYSEC